MITDEITALRKAAEAMKRDGQALVADQLEREAAIAEAFGRPADPKVLGKADEYLAALS